jgi:hypothetical protein
MPLSDFDDAEFDEPAAARPRQVGDLESLENLLGEDEPRRDDSRRGGRRRRR